MPSGIYIRTEEHKNKARKNLKMARTVSAIMPRTEKQLKASSSNGKIAGKLPKTDKQIETSKINGKLVSKLPKIKEWFDIIRRTGEENPSWKGGFSKCGEYIIKYSPNHPYSVNKYVLYHRLLVEERIGRYLLPTEEVHHVNKIKIDNRIENLMCFNSSSAHIRFHKNPDNVKLEEIIFDGRKLI